MAMAFQTTLMPFQLTPLNGPTLMAMALETTLMPFQLTPMLASPEGLIKRYGLAGALSDH
jgi:hypothetical protein